MPDSPGNCIFMAGRKQWRRKRRRCICHSSLDATMIEPFEHNRTAYATALALLDETNRAWVIHPTGTGKSLLRSNGLMTTPAGVFAWLSPSENIYDTRFENVRRASGFEPGVRRQPVQL